jgi:low affinity Fe/Cu permease
VSNTGRANLPTAHSRSRFSSLAKWTARMAGRPVTFGLALGVILVWIFTGPLFGFGDTWQLVINTGTTIVTFLMVFLIQNTQNVDSEAMQVKLDELIRSVEGAHNALLDLEQLEESELDAIRSKYRRLAELARADLRQGNIDTGSPATEGDDDALI